LYTRHEQHADASATDSRKFLTRLPEEANNPLDASGGPNLYEPLGDTLIISTLGSNEPLMPAFASVLSQYDNDKDGRLSLQEFRGDPDLGEHFGWIDENDDKFIDAEEWNKARSLGVGEWGRSPFARAARGSRAGAQVGWALCVTSCRGR
jgi:hypothetical protein